ncbi:uncharacterized protein LOC144625250 [Crassostrea virginica]
MYVNILCNVEGKVIMKLLCILKVFFSRTKVDLYMYTVVLQKMFPLQTLHSSDAAHLTFRVTANRLSGYMEDPLTSDFIESSVSSLCTGIRGRLHKILTVRRSIDQ